MTNVTSTDLLLRQHSGTGNSSTNSSELLLAASSTPTLPQLNFAASTIPASSDSPSQRRRVSSQAPPRKKFTLAPTAVAKRIFAQVASSKRNYSNMPSITLEAARAGPVGGGISGIPSHAQMLRQTSLSADRQSTPRSATAPLLRGINSRYTTKQFAAEKPLASSSGGALSIAISLAEPVLFLQGFTADDYQGQTPAMLRGSLVVRMTKPTKIKTITLTFRGRARTEWPEGIPPKKSEFFEEKEIMNHYWPFFNAQFGLEDDAEIFQPLRFGVSETNLSIDSSIRSSTRPASPVGTLSGSSVTKSDRRLSLQLPPSRSFGKGDSPQGSIVQKGYRIFKPGEYIYNFELAIAGMLPETIETESGSVKYELEATVERSGAFRPKLTGKKNVLLIRCPSETSMEQSEPIAISRTWEDQLHYDIVISGKSFPLGSTIPIAFKLTPLAKVHCHRIKIYMTENIEYKCKDNVHRIDPTKKVLLLEKRADGTVISAFEGSSVIAVSGGWNTPTGSQSPSSSQYDNLLGPLSNDYNIGPTEMEFNVQLPGCNARERDRLHFDTTYKDIRVHHWVKIVMRLSKADPSNPSKRRHFEISIDSPLHILSCRATQANTTLPAYSEPNGFAALTTNPCSCPPVSRRNSNKEYQITVPYSFSNPPPFDADNSPPLMTPPPRYETIVTNAPLSPEEYFSPPSDDTDEEIGRSGDETGRPQTSPLSRTPGSRLATRSLDEPRRWTLITS